ncbi:unnamed protein product [Clonostachys solani]|uniref:H-type lectin domain-containing protein n=1 Tax=Clonostachys solani TaxID=160281 RepID=A0A9P0EPZ5_9HYPO|nr:unnamed protein product [Clonostachys solani]
MTDTTLHQISHAVQHGAGHFHSDPAVADLEHQVATLVQRVELQEKQAAKLQHFVIDQGSWHTNDVRSWQKPEEKTSGRVNFSQKFSQVPKVTVSLRSVDTNKDYNTRVKVYTSDIDKTGFTIHADSWSNTQLYSAGVSWVAIGQ